MPTYMLILRGDVTKEMEMPSPDEFQALIQKYDSWAKGLAEKGLLKLGHKLQDQGGKVMMPEGDGVTLKDGPYVETKEVVGGYYLVKAENYDHAVELCRDHPNFLFGSIEIREVDWMGQPEED